MSRFVSFNTMITVLLVLATVLSLGIARVAMGQTPKSLDIPGPNPQIQVATRTPSNVAPAAPKSPRTMAGRLAQLRRANRLMRWAETKLQARIKAGRRRIRYTTCGRDGQTWVCSTVFETQINGPAPVCECFAKRSMGRTRLACECKGVVR